MERDPRLAFEPLPAAPSPSLAHPYEDSGGWARAAQGTLAICGVLSLASLVDSIWLLPLVEALDGRSSFDVQAWTAAVEAADRRTTLVSLAFLVAVVLCAIAFIGWLARSVANLPALTGVVPRATRRGAVLWWFVPIANLWKPYTIVREVKETIEQRCGPTGTTELLRTWWLLWVVGGQIGSLAARVLSREDPDGLGAAYWLFAFGEGLTALAAFCGLAIVRHLQAAQVRLAPWTTAGRRPSWRWGTGPAVGGTPPAWTKTVRSDTPTGVTWPIAPATKAASKAGPPAVDRGSVWLIPLLGLAATAAVALGAALTTPPVPGSGEAAWRTYRPPDGSFTIDVPGTPRVTTTDLGDGFLATDYQLDRSDHSLFIRVLSLPSPIDAADTFEGEKGNFEGGKLSRWEQVTREGFPAIDMAGAWDDGTWFGGLLLLTDERYYVLIASHADADLPADARRSLDSLHVSPTGS